MNIMHEANRRYWDAQADAWRQLRDQDELWRRCPEPLRVLSEVCRILKVGGYYVFYDIHPFLRPWKDQIQPIQMKKPYFETGPFKSEQSGQTVYEFHWTLQDILSALMGAGLTLRRVVESPAADSRFWQDFSYLPGTDGSLLDWRKNPRAGLPVWLTVAAEKRR